MVSSLSGFYILHLFKYEIEKKLTIKRINVLLLLFFFLNLSFIIII